MKPTFFAAVTFIATAIFTASCNNDKKDDNAGTVAQADTAAKIPAGDRTLQPGESMTITRADVPDTVIAVFDKKAPGATQVTYYKMRPAKPSDDSVVIYYYHFEYDKNGAKYHAMYTEQGEPVMTTNYKKIPGLPDAVSRVIADYFPGYTVEETDKENDKDAAMYEVELKNGEKKLKIRFLPDGGIYSIK